MKKIFLADADLGPVGQGQGFGPWNSGDPGTNIATIISKALGLLTIMAGIWFLFQVIIAGYNFMSAAGDKGRIENANRKLTNSIVGLIIVAAAYGLLALVGMFLGVNFLEIGTFIENISK
jgi:hypothetical protein